MSSSSLTEPSVASASTSFIAPKRTLFDIVDGAWQGVWDAFGLPSTALSLRAETHLIVAHDVYGWEWATIFAACGFGLRFITLFPSIYGERAVARMASTIPLLRPHYHEFLRVQRHPKVLASEKAFARKAFIDRRRAVHRQHGTSTLAASAGVWSAPLLIGGYSTVAHLAQSCDSVRESAFLWAPSLSAADPTFVLPLVAEAITLLNFNMMLQNRQGQSVQRDSLVRKQRLAALGFAVVVSPAVATLPAAIAVYWIAMATTGLIQPLCTRTEVLRQLLKFPERTTFDLSEEEAKFEALDLDPGQDPEAAKLQADRDAQKLAHYMQAKEGMEAEIDGRLEKLTQQVDDIKMKLKPKSK